MTHGTISADRGVLHLLGRFGELYTGAERELLDLSRLMVGRRNVRLWSDVPVHPGYAGEGITAVQPFAHQFPREGTLLFGGVHLQPGIWLKYTHFRRVIVFHNLSNQAQLFALVEGVQEHTGLTPEIVFVSDWVRRCAALAGPVIRSVLDLRPLSAVAEERFARQDESGLAPKPFTVGRASRDRLEKHSPQDVSLYRMLASRGVCVRIMGGTCLWPGLGETAGIELLPAGAEPVPDFYRSLDAVFYRTGDFFEAYGRVVLEAMGAGLPVVAHVNGGYAEVIEQGISGFLIRSQEEAFDALMALHDSVELRLSVGRAAEQRARELHGSEAAERDLAFYLG
ncbi:MAG: glycosyltransferase [Polaromonas sp.]|nr:glycosyltransferase [Polaromonas sp.]